jgi:anti-sigma-K factor RskA
MSDDSIKSLRERLTAGTEDKLGRALTDLLENPLLTGAIGRAFDAREKAAQAQEVAMGALNLPSAADIERLTRRLRSVSQRLEGIEDGVQRLDDTLKSPPVEERLSRIEQQLNTLAKTLDDAGKPRKAPVKQAPTAKRAPATPRATAKRAAATPKRAAATKSAAPKK